MVDEFVSLVSGQDSLSQDNVEDSIRDYVDQHPLSQMSDLFGENAVPTKKIKEKTVLSWISD